MNFWNVPAEKFAQIGAKTDISPDGIAYLRFLQKVLSEDSGHITKSYVSGNVKKDMNHYVEKLQEKGGRLIVRQKYDNQDVASFFWNDTIVEVDLSENGSVLMNVTSLNESLVDSIRELFKADLVSVAEEGYIFAIVQSMGGLQLQRIGFAGTPLERENYSPAIMEDYDFVVKDLQANSPYGRIVIMEGPAGSGKTHMVRSILMEVPDAMFVLVPPAMVSSMGGPQLLPLLLSHKQSYQKTGPIIFLLEDADGCLAPRASDNMDSVASILNIGDGIFGSIFDIRIIATTNAKQKDLDVAITRPGRLSKRIHVPRMSYEDAGRIFDRLCPGKMLPQVVVDEAPSMKPRGGVQDWSLAEVYKAARDHGWEPPVREDNKKSRRAHYDLDYDD